MDNPVAVHPLPIVPAYDDEALRAFTAGAALPVAEAARLRDEGHGERISFSRKVFIPLTQLCRDVCHYCTFAKAPIRLASPYLNPEQVLAIAEQGRRAGCHEALFTLGDKPELRYPAARRALDALGYETTLDYLAAVADLVHTETGLLPHVNAGVMPAADIARLRAVSVSQGLMLESASPRLCAPGGPHHGSPDKAPAARLETIRAAGVLRTPFTSGVLIGIGETRPERLDALLALRDLHGAFGHIQEIIVQNFRAKPGTRMAAAPEPDLDDLIWTIALARLVFGPHMNIQAPPNLSGDDFPRLIGAGLNDWGGISPVTPDHVNPEAAWPQLSRLAEATRAEGKVLVGRLAAYPAYCGAADGWQDARLLPSVLRRIDTAGYVRTDAWTPGAAIAPPAFALAGGTARPAADVAGVLAAAGEGERLSEAQIVRLFEARGDEAQAICAAADGLRAETVGDTVRYVVNRNINYTNVCGYKCRFCAFAKGRSSLNLRGAPYDLDLPEIVRRAHEAWDRGATEVCLQGGIHPDYTGETYLAICRALKAAEPRLHIHAFSPLEVQQGARTLGRPVAAFLAELKAAGLGTLPGTAAEILDDEVRAIICPDKIDTEDWLSVIEAAHGLGIRTTATMMFGHVERYAHWARHLLHVRDLQARTGGFTEFVPLPFVPMEAPMALRGASRQGPTFREAVLAHAVARLALHPLIPNIQVSWTKMGEAGARAALQAGANDLGGTLMNESISSAAGAAHGQEMAPGAMDRIIRGLGRTPEQRTTLYGTPPAAQVAAAYRAEALEPVRLPPAGRRAAVGGRMVATETRRRRSLGVDSFS